MAKYNGKYQKKKKNTGMAVLLAVLLILLGALVWIVTCGGPAQTEGKHPPAESTAPESAPSESVTPESAGEQEGLPEVTQPQTIAMQHGLLIHNISSYAGIYMEDGSGDVVYDVMMLMLENTADQDLQLARIHIEYSEFTAEFEVSNIPAGEKVVALEKNRRPMPEEEYQSIDTLNVVFFPAPMALQEERIRITGTDGSLEVENISGEDITGDIYVYYKHSASDLLYGGITYRVSVKGGLAAGEKCRVIAGHYTVEGCRILMVDCGD